jgi:methionine synthase II (cobalamin-independent)
MSTKLHRNPPFRAEHLGSLLRTDKLLEVRHANEAGKASDSELRTVEDSDVKDIVKTQLDLGYHAITDGEYRRHSAWHPGSQRDCRITRTDIGQCSGDPSGPDSMA